MRSRLFSACTMRHRAAAPAAAQVLGNLVSAALTLQRCPLVVLGMGCPLLVACGGGGWWEPAVSSLMCSVGGLVATHRPRGVQNRSGPHLECTSGG